MPDLIAFLRARLDEDEAAARAAGAGTWNIDDGMCCVVDPEEGQIAAGEHHGSIRTRHVEHMARWDPARVLAEVAAKRAVLELHDDPSGLHVCEDQLADASECRTLRAVAQPYASHPDFDPTWRT
jgi:hypothetical protein